MPACRNLGLCTVIDYQTQLRVTLDQTRHVRQMPHSGQGVERKPQLYQGAIGRVLLGLQEPFVIRDVLPHRPNSA